MYSQEMGSQEERSTVSLEGIIAKKVTQMKNELGIYFIFQIIFQVCTSLKYFIRYGYGFDVFLPIILTFLAISVGELGRRQSQTKFLRLYLVLSYIAMIVLFSTKRESVLVDFEYDDDPCLNYVRRLNKTFAMIIEIAVPATAAMITIPLICNLSSLSSSRSSKMKSRKPSKAFHKKLRFGRRRIKRNCIRN